MTKRITYTLISEGIAENCFIPNYLKTIADKNGITLTKSKKEIKRSSNPSKSKVIKNIYKLAIESLIIDNEDLFIAGVDLDQPDHTLELHTKEINLLKTELKDLREHQKIVLFVPIQAFDTWLLYHQKPKANGLEATNCSDIKKHLYGISNPDGATIEKVCNKILPSMDFGKLAKLSKSFKHFHDQVSKVLK